MRFFAIDSQLTRQTESGNAVNNAEVDRFGAAAHHRIHSFNGNVRRWSVQRPADYMVLPRYESERLDEREHFNEYVMTRLRCAEGIDTEYMRRRFGAERFERVMRDAGQWIASGELRYANGRLSIPTECMLVSDAVIESFFEA